MSCNCLIDTGYDAGFCVLLEMKTYKAKKQHICYECGRKIDLGEKYQIEKLVGDGFITVKTCSDCLSVRDAFFCTWVYGEMWQDVYEMLSDGNLPPSDCMTNITKNARDKICDIIEERWKE
jgi:hypothetical protein